MCECAWGYVCVYVGGSACEISSQILKYNLITVIYLVDKLVKPMTKSYIQLKPSLPGY